MRFDYGICASTGARKRQEDAARVLPLVNAEDAAADVAGRTAAPLTALAAVLSDGMGGHAGGAIASELACEAFLPEFINTPGAVSDRLRYALDVANNAIAAYIETDPTYSGMGATLIGAMFDTHGIQWISVGDSLLYHISGSDISLLNADHSLAPEIDRLAEMGQISWSEALSDPRRHYLRSAITGDEIDLIDTAETAHALTPGDVVIIASDGINSLAPAEIAAIVHNAPDASARALAEQLIAAVAAKAVPHQDNTTVTVVRAHV